MLSASRFVTPVVHRSVLPGIAHVMLACVLLSTAAAQPSVVGEWSSPVSWPFAASHAVLLPDGRVLAWNDLGELPQIWDPGSETFASAAAPDTIAPRAAEVLLADGSVAILGGRAANDSGATTVVRFDVADSTWQSLPDLNLGREEPTAVLVGDAQIAVLSGQIRDGIAADVPEKAQPGTGWVLLNTAERALPNRPWSFTLSTGEILVAGPERTTRVLDLALGGNWTVLQDMLLGSRDAGCAVLVPGWPDRVLITGGRDPATNTCEVLDLPTTTAWRSTGSMTFGRRHHNATILADGSVLVTGGTLVDDELQFAALAAELYDPVTETWSVLDSMTVARRRGSVALLLPDARVLVAGGGDGSPGSELHADAEIFSPPYLFAGTRPVVTSAPDSLVYGDSLTVMTPEADSVAAAWLVRCGSVSGSFNADQRAIQLAFAALPGEIHTTAPADSNAAPPGTYMLFLVHQSGAPSVAHLLQLAVAPPPLSLPVITSMPPPTGSVGVQYVYDADATSETPVTWSLEDAPAWMMVNDINGIVTGIPDAEQTFLVTLRATNADGFVEQAWSIDVGGTPRTVIPLGAQWRYFKGLSDPGSDWANIDYPDSTWLLGSSGFGYGDGDDATVLDDMQGNYSTVYTRHAFQLFHSESVTRLGILHDYDDGFAVFLNGTRILDERAPDPVLHTSTATGSHEAQGTLTLQELTDPTTLALLQDGTNVLAAVGLNRSLGSNDMTLKIELEITGGAEFPTDTETAVTPFRVRPFPNPFRRSTQFRFALRSAGSARLELFDVRGRRIRALVAPALAAGVHAFEWDGRDALGHRVVPGVYFYRLRTPDFDDTGKLVRRALAVPGF